MEMWLKGGKRVEQPLAIRQGSPLMTPSMILKPNAMINNS